MPQVHPLLDRVLRLTEASYAAGVIDEDLAFDMGWLIASLWFVIGKSLYVQAVAYD